MTVGRRKTSPMAPYFVQLREFERRLLRGAIEEAEGEIATAAQMLGVTPHYVSARAKLLGGVVGDEPKHEPPGPAAAAWNATVSSGRERKKRRQQSTPAPENVDA